MPDKENPGKEHEATAKEPSASFNRESIATRLQERERLQQRLQDLERELRVESDRLDAERSFLDRFFLRAPSLLEGGASTLRAPSPFRDLSCPELEVRAKAYAEQSIGIPERLAVTAIDALLARASVLGGVNLVSGIMRDSSISKQILVNNRAETEMLSYGLRCRTVVHTPVGPLPLR